MECSSQLQSHESSRQTLEHRERFEIKLAAQLEIPSADIIFPRLPSFPILKELFVQPRNVAQPFRLSIIKHHVDLGSKILPPG